MFAVAAETLAGLTKLRDISRAIAVAVGVEAMEEKIAPTIERAELEKRIDEAMWFPEYAKLAVD